jgi:hypothetical protein
LSVFHQDMVWPWPRTSESHDPTDWIFGMGRFNYQRWKKGYSDLFESHKLIHNVREIRKTVISDEGDGAFAVVDVDTLWKNIKTKEDFHWKGKACKIYTRMAIDGKWKMIAHTGLLDYSKKEYELTNTQLINKIKITAGFHQKVQVLIPCFDVLLYCI